MAEMMGTRSSGAASNGSGGQGISDTASRAADEARSRVQGGAGRTKQAAGTAIERTKESASTARDKAMEKADEQKSQLAGKGHDLTSEAEKVAETLRKDGYDKPAQLIETVASQLDEMVEWVEKTPVQQMLQDARRQVRKSPFTYMGAALALGFASTRFLTAGTSSDDEGSQELTTGSTGIGRGVAGMGDERDLVAAGSGSIPVQGGSGIGAAYGAPTAGPSPVGLTGAAGVEGGGATSRPEPFTAGQRPLGHN